MGGGGKEKRRRRKERRSVNNVKITLCFRYNINLLAVDFKIFAAATYKILF